jgi:hypothetical protein
LDGSLQIKSKVLYLRREALLVAVEKLKNGETIGPVTKAYKDKEGEEKEQDGETKKEEDENAAEKKQDTEKKDESEKVEGQTETEKVVVKKDKEEDASDKDSSEKEDELTTAPESPISEASEQTVKLAADTEESKEPTPKLVDSDATSEATSIESDLPPTPASVEPITASNETEPEPDLDEFVQANIHESLELRNPVPSKPASTLTAEDKLLPITPPVPETPTVTEPPKPTSSSTDPAIATAVPPLVRTEGPIPTVVVNGTPEEDETKTEVVIPEQSAKTMVGWEMLEMCVNWVIKEFSTDEEALARQLSNNEISFRFLWLYFVPGTVVSLQDPVSKQQMAARVISPTILDSMLG